MRYCWGKLPKEHEGERKDAKTREMREEQQQVVITVPYVSHQYAPEGLFIEVVIYDHYNVCNVSVHLI
jgi:hypothetical protein